uniref:HSac2 domain-containing protein n=1 Tax=Periophthalmus magnuspinnatus TaxID=409849 RepID=A0A3B4ALF4_9GOBI
MQSQVIKMETKYSILLCNKTMPHNYNSDYTEQHNSTFSFEFFSPLRFRVDHWNNEKERLVIVAEHSLLVFKYDFLMFNCEQLQRIPLHFVDRITHGNFSFPKYSLLKREMEGVRVHWDRQREPSFTSRWNPFATDMPFITFTLHPVQTLCPTYTSLCDVSVTSSVLKKEQAPEVWKENIAKPVLGRANGVLLLNQPVYIDAFVGAMSNLGNGNKLGYSMARGNLGF